MVQLQSEIIETETINTATVSEKTKGHQSGAGTLPVFPAHETGRLGTQDRLAVLVNLRPVSRTNQEAKQEQQQRLKNRNEKSSSINSKNEAS